MFMIKVNGALWTLFLGRKGLRQDDVMLLCKASISFIKMLVKCLQNFAKWSGLAPYPIKSHSYFRNAKPSVITIMLAFLKIFCRLNSWWVPLIAAKLWVSNCVLLLEKYLEESSNGWRGSYPMHEGLS